MKESTKKKIHDKLGRPFTFCKKCGERVSRKNQEAIKNELCGGNFCFNKKHLCKKCRRVIPKKNKVAIKNLLCGGAICLKECKTDKSSSSRGLTKFSGIVQGGAPGLGKK